MYYTMDEKEHKQNRDELMELIHLRIDYRKLEEKNKELELIKLEYEKMKDDLCRCIDIELEDNNEYPLAPNLMKVIETNIRKHSIVELIFKNTDVADLYNKEQLLDTINFI